MWKLYLITRLDSLFNTFLLLAIFSSIVFCVLFAMALICSSEDELYSEESSMYSACKKRSENLSKYARISLISASAFFFLCLITPTTKEACAIYVGDGIIEYVKGSEKLREMPDNIVNLADEYIKGMLKEENND